MRSGNNNTTRPPAPLAAAHGEERKRESAERQRGERAIARRERRERVGSQERETSWGLGFSDSGVSLQSFALLLSFWWEKKEVEACIYKEKGEENLMISYCAVENPLSFKFLSWPVLGCYTQRHCYAYMGVRSIDMFYYVQLLRNSIIISPSLSLPSNFSF